MIIEKKLKKIITYLEDIGSELSRIDKIPASEKQAWKLINKRSAAINELLIDLLQTNKIKNKKLVTALKKAKHRDFILYWPEIADKLKEFI